MAFTVVTVTQAYDRPDGIDPVGTVAFTPSQPMVNGTTVVAAPVTRRLNIDGLLLIDVAANTDPATVPDDTVYRVDESIEGVTRSYGVTIPHDAGPLVDLSTLDKVFDAPPVEEDSVDPVTVLPQWAALLGGKVDRSELIGTYKRAEDPRAHGLTGGANDSPALQAAIDAAGAGGVVELPPLSINYGTTLTLPTGMEFRGSGMKASTLAGTTDIACLSTLGGEGQSIKNLKISNSFTGTRTTYDIDICNPFKPVLEHVEIALSQSSLAKGGIRLYKTVGQTGDDKCFMPVLTDVWVRNGVLRIADVTDVKVQGGWVWGTYTGAPGAVELSGASNCSFTDFDVVPSTNAGYLVSGHLSNLLISGGLVDGSYDTIQTGWGIKSTDYIRGLVVMGVKFWNIWLGGIKLTDVRRATIMGCTFNQNNKGDTGTAEIDLASAQSVAVIGNNFGAPLTRSTPGKVYVEDSACTDNIIAYNVVEYDGSIVPNGNYYASSMFTIRTGTTVQNNLPDLSWPQTTLLTKSSNYTITKYDLFGKNSLNATGTATMTLPSAGSVHSGDQIPIKNSGTGTITVATTSSQTIDGVTSVALAPQQTITPRSDGSNWFTTVRPTLAPAAIISLPNLVAATVWPSANRAVFQRFSINTPAVYRYLRWKCDTASGNVQLGVVQLSGTDHASYTRIAHSGVIACPTAGDIRTDLAAFTFGTGDYAMFLWADNTTFQCRYGANSGITVVRSNGTHSGLTSGVQSTGTLTWDTGFVCMTLEADV